MRAAVLLALAACGDDGGSATPDAFEPVCTHLQNLRTVKSKVETFGTFDAKHYDGTICIEGRADITCATSAADKTFALCGPSDADFGVRFTLTGFENTIYLHGPSQTPPLYRIADDGYAATAYWRAIGGTYPPPADQGNLVVIATKTDGTGLSGATIAVTPAPTLGVVYLGDTGLPDDTLTATRMPGVGLVANAPIGNYDITVTAPGITSCAFVNGGVRSPDTAQQIRIPATGATTVVAELRCSP